MDKPIYQPPIVPPVRPVGPPPSAAKPGKVPGADFANLLDKAIHKLSFSNHAEQRLATRNIRLTEGQLQRLEQAVGKAEAKGAKDALVLVDGTAFVVSVTNKKVITAIDEGSVRENVFTNIDSAIIT